MAVTPVKVAVEAVLENQIQEVTLDGHELYVQSLSMTDNLTKLAHNIDFYKDESAEKGKPTSEGAKESEDDKTLATFQPSLWPWDSVRNKLKSALTEVSVLLDVINIAREKKYMVLDPVQQDPPDSKTAIQMIGKKKSLSAASSILLSGADRLKRSQLEITASRGSQHDFHSELVRLRQNWRLKRVGNTILGDLSYRSAGSRFLHNGTFEVIKGEEGSEAVDVPPSKSSLQVHIPSELEGVAYIQVAIKRVQESKDVASAILKIPTNLESSVPSDASCQHKLESAQNVIFCKELFNQLAREAVHMKSPIPHVVIGKQIISNLFPGVQLSIALCHYTGKDKKSQGMQQRPDHNHVLEHSLHQLLREVHYKNIHHPMPHPVTATLGVSKRRRLAGPCALSRQEIVEMMQGQNLLDQIIDQAKHTVLRQRTMQLLDEISTSTSDPLISNHWNSLSSALESTVKVNIISQGYDVVRTRLALHISVDGIKAVCKDGRTIQLSYEEQEIRDLILQQIAQHQVTVLQNLSKMMSWQILSINFQAGVGELEQLGNASTVMMASPTGDKVLSIRSGPSSGVHVALQISQKKEDGNNGPLVKTAKWNTLGSSFRQINLQEMEGSTFVTKIELLLASLTKVP